MGRELGWMFKNKSVRWDQADEHEAVRFNPDRLNAEYDSTGVRCLAGCPLLGRKGRWADSVRQRRA